MKKIVLIVLIVFSTLNLFSQIEKGRIIVSIDGNYIKSTTENGVTLNQNVSQIKNFNIGTSVGYFMTDRFVVGVGLDYYWNKESRKTEMMINRFFQIEVMNIESNAFLPNIYLGYYYPILNKLYMNANLKLSYGKVKADYNTLIAGSVYYQSDTMIIIADQYSSTYVKGSEKSSSIDLVNAEIIPELTYFISSKFGLCLGLGGIEYSMIDWETDNSSWTINFNPVNWRFGIKLKI
jgi:hypothetical protein